MVLCGVCDDGHPGFLHPALPLLPHRFLENWCARVRARAHTHTPRADILLPKGTPVVMTDSLGHNFRRKK